MNQECKVCGEPAAGFHFGAFTCEGCKSFFGRTYNNVSSISECKNNDDCIIDKKNRTSCKACRLRKCLLVGMSKSGSRFGRRSNWFKIHCLLQEQQQQHRQRLQQQQQGERRSSSGDMDVDIRSDSIESSNHKAANLLHKQSLIRNHKNQRKRAKSDDSSQVAINIEESHSRPHCYSPTNPYLFLDRQSNIYFNSNRFVPTPSVITSALLSSYRMCMITPTDPHSNISNLSSNADNLNLSMQIEPIDLSIKSNR